MNKANTRKFSILTIIISLAAGALLLNNCFSPFQGDGATITISVGSNSASARILSTSDIDQLNHTIRIYNGPGPDLERKDIIGSQTVSFTVNPGTWDVRIEAFYNGILYATGNERIDVKAGQNNSCPIDMNFFKVGDRGPGGGIIFYVADGIGSRVPFTVQGYGAPGDPDYFAPYTAYYLEAAPGDMPTVLAWQSPNNDDIITVTGLGSGRRNTAIIHASSDSTPAASTCVAYRAGGLNDWFLPSRDELDFLYQYWDTEGRPSDFNLTTDWYWSSSRGNYSYNTWRQDFGNGIQNYGEKSTTNNARAIRAF